MDRYRSQLGGPAAPVAGQKSNPINWNSIEPKNILKLFGCSTMGAGPVS